MLRFHFSLGILFCLAFSPLCISQDTTQTKAVPDKQQSDSPAPVPDAPDEISMESSFGIVELPHKVHVKDVKLKCVVCHHQIHATELDTPHPDFLTSSRANCQTCHEPNSATSKKYYKCSLCHHSDLDDIADETLSAKVVVHKSCWKCHVTGTGVQASESCTDCHARQASASPVLN